MAPRKLKQKNLELFAELLSSFPQFCSLLQVQDKDTADLFQFSHDTWHEPQKQFELNRSGWDIVLKPRQIGFSTLEFARDIYFAIVNPLTNTLIICQEHKIQKSIAGTIRGLYKRLLEVADTYKLPVPKIVGQASNEKIELDNGSVIYFSYCPRALEAAKDAWRGTTLHRIHATEVALWAYPHEFLSSVLKAGSSAKEIVFESTPFGASGYFYDKYMAAKRGKDPKFTAHFFPWFLQERYQADEISNPDFDPKPLKEYREIELHRAAASYGLELTDKQLAWWRETVEGSPGKINEAIREYAFSDDLCFQGSDNTWLDTSDIEWIRSTYVDPVDVWVIQTMQISIYHPPHPANRYLIGIDTSEARGDASALVVIDARSGELCATGKDHTVDGKLMGHIASEVGRRYNDALIVVERQSQGSRCLDSLQAVKYKKLYYDRKNKAYGWHSNSATRPMLFFDVRTAVKDKLYQIKCRDLGDELQHIVVDPNTLRPEHAKGKHDDLVVSWGLALCVRAQNTLSANPSVISGGTNDLAGLDSLDTWKGDNY